MSTKTATSITAARLFVDKFNEDYAAKHMEFEHQFWGTKMALSGEEFSTENLTKTKKVMEDLLSNPEMLKTALQHRSNLDSSSNEAELVKILDVIIKTGKCYDMTGHKDAKQVREETNKIESELEMARNQKMKLGYVDKDGVLQQMSSVGLRNLMRTSPDEDIRKAAYEGLRSIGPFVCSNGFCEIVKLRNKLAKMLGYEDYYDYTVSNSEGFSKDHLFSILDGLEKGTRPLMEKARTQLAEKYGKTALDPWNTSFMMAGSVIQKMDPYFPFAKSVERYMRSYAAMGITYEGATMSLDLLDRPNKYSNGFCHWPVPSWIKPDGTWVPSQTNFTSLADPAAVGSGHTALTTLMHEAGHAAHFANVKQPSPLFSQERSPTSVAYAENQSMFLDSLVGDSAWRAKYARDLENNPIPFDILEEDIRATHPFAVFSLRAMLVVSYFEKALYELPDDEVTSENVQRLADQVETQIQCGPSPRPLLSVPHLVSDEASCYYQGYTLAEMSVHQTREYFKEKYGYIVDNPNVGPELKKNYWEYGNSRQFLDLVKDLTGKPLSGDAWVESLREDVDDLVHKEKLEYQKMMEKCSNEPESDEQLDLDMTVKFVDGDTLIADSAAEGGLLQACHVFEKFVSSRLSSK